jgi:hypothetical protein
VLSLKKIARYFRKELVVGVEDLMYAEGHGLLD